MFNCTSAFLFLIFISSCSGKAVSSSNTNTQAPPQSASTVKASADKQAPTKSPSDWPKVDAYNCNGNNEVRSLHIELIAPKGCKLWYSNFSKSEPIAQSKNGLSYCEQVNNNIRHNLENAGYTCAPKDANKPTK